MLKLQGLELLTLFKFNALVWLILPAALVQKESPETIYRRLVCRGYRIRASFISDFIN